VVVVALLAEVSSAEFRELRAVREALSVEPAAVYTSRR
jgi:hypothetical protein